MVSTEVVTNSYLKDYSKSSLGLSSSTSKANNKYCDVCARHLLNNHEAEIHYTAKDHLRKVQLAKIKIEVMQEFKLDEDGVKRCNLCSKIFCTAEVARVHYKSKIHVAAAALGKKPSKSSKRSLADVDVVKTEPESDDSENENPSIKVEEICDAEVPAKKSKPKVEEVHCAVCNISLNSQQTYEIHIAGSKHKKRLTGPVQQVQSQTAGRGRGGNRGFRRGRGRGRYQPAVQTVITTEKYSAVAPPLTKKDFQKKWVPATQRYSTNEPTQIEVPKQPSLYSSQPNKTNLIDYNQQQRYDSFQQNPSSYPQSDRSYDDVYTPEQQRRLEENYNRMNPPYNQQSSYSTPDAYHNPMAGGYPDPNPRDMPCPPPPPTYYPDESLPGGYDQSYYAPPPHSHYGQNMYYN